MNEHDATCECPRCCRDAKLENATLREERDKALAVALMTDSERVAQLLEENEALRKTNASTRAEVERLLGALENEIRKSVDWQGRAYVAENALTKGMTP